MKRKGSEVMGGRGATEGGRDEVLGQETVHIGLLWGPRTVTSCFGNAAQGAIVRPTPSKQLGMLEKM